MRLNVKSFDRSRHLEPASILLAERHVRDREREPFFPAAFEAPPATRALIERVLENPHTDGVVAEQDGEIVGFLLMTMQLTEATHFLSSFFPARGAGAPYTGHATKAGMEYDVYREMYRILADRFVKRGVFDHSINFPAADKVTHETWESLGFGRASTCAIRDVSPTARAASDGVELHMAGEEDIDVVLELNRELALHHARSPIFFPHFPESDPAIRDYQKNLLTDTAHNTCWVAYKDGQALGMNTFMDPYFLSPMTVPENCIYLFQGIVSEKARAGGVGTAILSRGVEWAREQGYEHIALHFMPSNLPGSAFWTSSGFRPVEHGLRRRVDERVAWAGEAGFARH
jgi:GNAT superfamily N-acetyltransferase